MIRAILFDLDDTLVDFKGMKTAAISEAAKAMVKAGLDMSVKTANRKLSTVYWEDIEFNTAISEFLKRVGKLDDRILAAGINGYIKGKLATTKTVDGGLQTLRQLKKKYKLAVVTDAPSLKAWQRLNLMGIDNMFDAVVTFDDTGRKKPDSLPFKIALRKLGVKPEEAVMVGDWYERDVIGAKNLGMKAVLVGKACGIEDHCVRDIKGLLQIL